MGILDDHEARRALARYVKPDSESVDQELLLGDLADTLVRNHSVSEATDEAVLARAATTPELTREVFGLRQEIPVLSTYIAAKLSPTVRGGVQRALRDGFVLMSKRTVRRVVIDGVERSMGMSGRFVSDNPAVINEYLLEALAGQQERRLEGVGATLSLVAVRQPALRQAIAEIIARETRATDEILQRKLQAVTA